MCFKPIYFEPGGAAGHTPGGPFNLRADSATGAMSIFGLTKEAMKRPRRHFTCRFSADSLPRLATTSKLTLAPSTSELKPAFSTAAAPAPRGDRAGGEEMTKTPGGFEPTKPISKAQRDARKAFRQVDAEKAMTEHDIAQKAFSNNRERLKAERLAREAAELKAKK